MREWGGFVYLSAAADPGPLTADLPLDTLANWPLDSLAEGHATTMVLECNWKLFWENFSECLHCPGIHPSLCDRVPLYGRGVMEPREAPGFTGPAINGESWTSDGAAVAPPFPRLTEAERAAGHTYLTFWPSTFVVGHVDHVRTVRLEPLGPTRTRLVTRWLFAPEALPGIDASAVAAFASQVMAEDGAVVEMNQRGLASPAFQRGTLMPEEHEVHRFQSWVLERLEQP